MFAYTKQVFVLFALTLVGVSFPAIVVAHPHMSLDSRIEFEYSGENCVGFWLDWTFDPYFSAAIIQENDQNRDKKFDEKEAKNVYAHAFQNLRKYGYFVFIRTGNKRVQPDQVEKFVPQIRGDLLVYRFYVDLTGKGYGNDFYIAVFDPTFYCAVRIPQDSATTHQTDLSAGIPKWECRLNKKYPVYYNPQGTPTDMTSYSKWKPGLQTAYPEEIHVYFP
jgi:ABC-type uncharacterized transport system substrate-binding protein